MSFSQRLTNLMKSKGITSYRMSKDTGIPEATIGRWKNGKAVPIGDKLITAVKYLDTSADYLLGNEQKNKPDAISAELGPKEKIIWEKLKQIRVISEDDYELAVAQLDLILNRSKMKDKK